MKKIGNLILIVTLFLIGETARADFMTAKSAYETGNFVLALKDLTPLAESGNPEAQALLGVMYTKGQGVEKNDFSAFDWYAKAATQGNTEAQLALSDMYGSGTGVDKDAVMSAYWQWKAAEAFEKSAREALDREVSSARPYQVAIEINLAEKGMVQINPNKKIRACMPDYPDYNRLKTFHGSSIADILIGADGKAIAVEFEKESGLSALDSAVRSSFRRCVFSPLVSDGKPTESHFVVKYVWLIH